MYIRSSMSTTCASSSFSTYSWITAGMPNSSIFWEKKSSVSEYVPNDPEFDPSVTGRTFGR